MTVWFTLLRAFLAAGGICVCTTTALAQRTGESPLSGIEVSPRVGAGVAIAVVVRSDPRPPDRCGLYVEFGDGDSRNVKIGSETQFPAVLAKTYKQTGTYTITATGRKITTHLPCDGALSAQVVVDSPAGADAARVPSGTCPEQVKVRNAAGTEVVFGLRQMVVDAGGPLKAREQMAARLIDSQARALDDTRPAAEREQAKQLAISFRTLHEQLSLCN